MEPFPFPRSVHLGVRRDVWRRPHRVQRPRPPRALVRLARRLVPPTVIGVLAASLVVGTARGEWISARFGARLTPQAVVAPTEGATGHGRFSGEVVSAHPGCIYGCAWARYRLSYSRLTGRPTDIAIRFGRTGEIGRVWYRLCGDLFPMRCPRAPGSLRGRLEIFSPNRLPRYIYVQISTEQNPRGELRGQVRFS